MVNQELSDSINLIRIIFFVYINVLYSYVAIIVWRGKIDRLAKIVLLIFYLAFFIDFLSAVFEDQGYIFAMFSVSCYVINQLSSILILHETKRVKLVLTSKVFDEYVAGMRNLQLEKNFLIASYLISLIISYARVPIMYNFAEVYQSYTIPFAILIIIDSIIYVIGQVIILISFYSSFRFFRDQYIQNAGHVTMPCKFILLTCWIIFLILNNIFELAVRIFVRVLQLKGGVNGFEQDWARDIWFTSIGLFTPFANFCEVFTYCIMIITMSQSATAYGNKEQLTFESLGSNEYHRLSYDEDEHKDQPFIHQKKDSRIHNVRKQDIKAKKVGENLAQNAIQRWANSKRSQNQSGINNADETYTIFQTKNTIELNSCSINTNSIDLQDDDQTPLTNELQKGFPGLEIYTGFLEQLTIGNRSSAAMN